MSRRRAIQTAAIAAMLVMAGLWRYQAMLAAQGGAESAQGDLEAARRIVAKIQAFRDRPSEASESEHLATETITLVEKAVKAAGIDIKNLVRISPGSPTRVGDSAYKEKPTQVFVRSVPLRQLVALTHSLMQGPQKLRAKAIRLVPPLPDDPGDDWNAELTLTYLIYEPQRNK